MQIRLLALVLGSVAIPGMLAAQAPATTAAPTTAPGGSQGEYNDIQDEFAAYRDARTGDYNAHRYNLVIDAFERPEEWRGEMGRSEGYITLRRIYAAATQLAGGVETFIGTPQGAGSQEPRPAYRGGDGAYESRYFEDLNYPSGTPPTTGATGYTLQNSRVLGARVDFFRRGLNTFAIIPPNPIFIEGEVKGFEVYVLGRNARHRLFLMLRDIEGNNIKLEMGTLDFQGWARMRVVVPPQINQARWVGGAKRGLYFNGFYVLTDIDSSRGQYYMYFDNMSATVDRFWEETQDPSEPLDVW